MKQIKEIPDSNPFRVPEGYFESLTDRTMSAIKENDKEGEKDVHAVKRIRLTPFIAMAAAILGFAVITASVIRIVQHGGLNAGGSMENTIYAELMTADIDTYTLESELFLTQEEYPEELAVESEDIIDYLLLEDVELTDIYEFL